MVVAYIIPNSIDSSYYDLYIQSDGEIYANKNSSLLFFQFKNVDSINNIRYLNTSNVTTMYKILHQLGAKNPNFTLNL